MESYIANAVPDRREPVACKLLSDCFGPNPPSPRCDSTVSASQGNDLLHLATSTGGIIGGTLAARAMEIPLKSEIAALVSRYPGSAWKSPSWTDIAHHQPRIQLENVASYGKLANSSHPEAQELLAGCKSRGFRSGLYSTLAGSAINAVLDKTVFDGQQYGVFTAAFDSVGVFSIAAMPGVPIVVKTGLMVAGHMVARKVDDSRWCKSEPPPTLVQRSYLR